MSQITQQYGNERRLLLTDDRLGVQDPFSSWR